MAIKKRRLKRRYTRKGRKTRAMRKWLRSSVRKYYYRRYRFRRAKTKTGRLWKYVKKVTRKEKGRLDALMNYNPSYQEANSRGIAGVTDNTTKPYRLLGAILTGQWWSKTIDTEPNLSPPSFEFSESDASIITGQSYGSLGYYVGYQLRVAPRQGTAKNEVSGNEFMLDSLNFSFTCHRKEAQTTTAVYRDRLRGGSISFYLIIEPTADDGGGTLTPSNIYSKVFDNTRNYFSGAFHNESSSTIDQLRLDYYNKKRNLNLNPRVRIIRLFKLDYSTSGMAVTRIVHDASIGTGADVTEVTNGDPRVPFLYHYDNSADFVKSFKVSIKVGKKLKFVQPVDAKVFTSLANQKTAYLSNLGQHIALSGYKFWLLPCSSSMHTTNVSHVDVLTQCEATFHDV